MPSRRFSTWIFLAVFTCGFLAVREWQRLPDDRTHISFLDIGQGDAALIQTTSGKQIVIDGGPDWSALEKIGEELPFFDRSIDMAVISHPHMDHYASFPELLARYDVRTLVISGVGNESAWMRRILDAAAKHGTRVVTVTAGETLRIDGLEFDVLWPPVRLPKQFVSNLNNVSVVLKLRSGTHSVLFSGDMEKLVEDTLVAAKADMKSEILKVGHHGSKTSSSTGMLLAIRPTVAVISVGKDNTFKHPNPGVLDRLETMGVTVHRTDTEGTVRVEW